MSAGTGIQHSEFNGEKERDLKLLQIWLFPNKQSVTPRYDQLVLPERKPNVFQQILSPNTDDAGVWIHQDAWFNMIDLQTDKQVVYTLNKPETNGVYAFVISGEVTIAGQALKSRDGLGLWEVDTIELAASANAEILLMEVPMKLG
jgi:redox-sensitive bicupin YhaK (pirin superfamily)